MHRIREISSYAFLPIEAYGVSFSHLGFFWCGDKEASGSVWAGHCFSLCVCMASKLGGTKVRKVSNLYSTCLLLA